MRRTKQVAASPVRDSSAAWSAIEALLRSSLETSNVDILDVDRSLAAAAPVMRMLVAAAYLDTHPLTIACGSTVCDVFTVSGAAAMEFDENLNPIVGMSGADSYSMQLPLGMFDSEVCAAAAADPYLTTEQLGESSGESGAVSTLLIDLDALRKAAGEL